MTTEERNVRPGTRTRARRNRPVLIMLSVFREWFEDHVSEGLSFLMKSYVFEIYKDL